MTEIIEILGSIQESGESVCIYRTKSEAGNFIFGKVLAFTEDCTAVYLIAPNGRYDGVVVINTDSIFSIVCGGKYVAKMDKLTEPDDYNQFLHTLSGKDIRRQLLEIAAKEHKIVAIELLDSGIYDHTGFVQAVDGGKVNILIVDEYGYDDGSAVFNVDDITEISYFSGDEQIIQRLWEKNQHD